MPYPYIIQDLLVGIGNNPLTPNGGVYSKLSRRLDVLQIGPQAVADACLEYSNSYPFCGLQRTTNAPVQMQTNVYQYPFSTWVNPGDIPTPLNQYNAYPKMIPSFFMYYNVPISLPGTGSNPGTQLVWKSIDSLELMFSTPGQPAYWSRHGQSAFIAPQPNNNFFSYMRYQIQHPFSQPAVLTDPILLDDDWREIIEYGAAMRIAGNLRMLDYASQYKNILYGDPKKPGDLGLYTARVSQMENDIVSNQGMRQIRPMTGRWI